jgi:hypothetical protein
VPKQISNWPSHHPAHGVRWIIVRDRVVAGNLIDCIVLNHRTKNILLFCGWMLSIMNEVLGML